jgi:hypothetical protein
MSTMSDDAPPFEPDPDFPTLPLISDADFAQMTEPKKFDRHVLEVAEAAKLFDGMQAAGASIFVAAENVPTPRMNRTGMPQARLRALYQEHRR